jgi:predicted regulator of Ras-like GTPase activity (Roadblock/LC7/MglB family)
MTPAATKSPNAVEVSAETSPEQLLENAFCELPHIESLFLLAPGGEVVFASEELARHAELPALVSGLWKLAQRTSDELERGKINYIALQSQSGHIVATRLGQGHILILLGRPDVRLGLIFYDLESLSARLSMVLAS